MDSMGFPRVLALLFVVACGSSSDGDGDGFNADVDCDDGNPAVHPEAPEMCNGVDDNCNAMVDDDPGDGTVYHVDADGDGFGTDLRYCAKPAVTVDKGGDCHDDNATAYPGSMTTEVPKDGIDTDCDGNDFCTDLNCDGRPDIVLPSHHDGDYSVTQSARLLSNGGGWALDPTPITQNGTLGTAIADLDNDGKPDIVHASYNDGVTVNTDSFVYWSSSNHAAASRTALPTHGAHWACLADFDKNGWTDILFVDNTDGDPQTESYIYRNRPGGFAPLDRVVLPTNGATHCATGDLDGDGFIDILISNYNGGTFANNAYVYWGSEAADYKKKTELPSMGNYASSIVDVDKDGKLDIILWSHRNETTYQTGENYLYWNRGGFSTANRTALAGNGGFRGAVADLNNDGFNDIVVGGYHDTAWTNPAPTYIYWGAAQNAYATATRTSITHKGVLEVSVDDINGDGFLDLLLPAQYDGDSLADSAIMWGTAGGTFTDANRTQLAGYHVTRGAAIVDFNHDGYKDIFLPGYHNNTTGADATPWANQAFSRIYWGSATGLRATFYDQWPSRGAWGPTVVGE